MRYVPIMLVCVAGGALAQSAPYENPAVVEKPAGPSTQVLLYPGGQYGRIVRNDLREPDEGKSAGAVHAPSAMHKTANVPAPETRPRMQARKPHAASPVARTEPPAPVKIVNPVPPVAPPKVVAMAQPPKPMSADHSGIGGGTILFDRNATAPREASVADIGKLADGLNNALSKDRSRIQITAYAGPKGDTSGGARRIALKRALIVRQLLIDGGLSSTRIDVRAVGGATDNGAPDRVDVSVKG